MLTLDDKNKDNDPNIPIIDLYKNELVDYKLKKFAFPEQTIYFDNSAREDAGVNTQKLDLNNDYVAFPNMKPNKRYAFFISGSSGSGKTTTTANLIKIFIDYKPDINIIYYTGCPQDDPLDDYLKRICNNNLIKITPQDIMKDNAIILSVDMLHRRFKQMNGEVLVVMDDIESISNKQIRMALLQFQDEILERGRSHGKNFRHIHLISVIHSTQNWMSTRKLLKECNYSIFNLRVVSTRTINNILEIFGYDKNIVNCVLEMKKQGQQITFFSKDYPFIIFNNNNIILQN